MPREINLPQWGMAMNDGTVVKWLKNIGKSNIKHDMAKSENSFARKGPL